MQSNVKCQKHPLNANEIIFVLLNSIEETNFEKKIPRPINLIHQT